MIRRPPRSTLSSSSAASDVYKRQVGELVVVYLGDDAPLREQESAVPRSELSGSIDGRQRLGGCLTNVPVVSESGDEGLDGAGVADLAKSLDGSLALPPRPVFERGNEGLDGAGVADLAKSLDGSLAHVMDPVLVLECCD